MSETTLHETPDTAAPEETTHSEAAPAANELDLEITPKAREMFLGFLEAEESSDAAVRLAITGRGGGGFRYELDIVSEDEAPDHRVVDVGDFKMLIDPASVENLRGVKIDFLKRGLESGFHFDNPNGPWRDNPAAAAVQEVLDTRINPAVASHGGHVTLLDVKDGTAYVSLGGGCQGCGMADVTLKQGIETEILESVPGVERVLDTTDHAAGENPYFDPARSGDSPFV